MPRVDKAWCPYCIIDAVTHFTTLGLLLPEAIEAVAALWGSRRRRVKVLGNYVIN